MLTENGMQVDMDALREVLLGADLLTIGFGMLAERLLIDTRQNRHQGPMVAIVPPVATVQERYLWLGKHRGSFGAPKAFSFFVWPHSVRYVIDAQVLAPIRERVAALSTDAAAQLDVALDELRQREHAATVAAVRGDEPWNTLWECQPGP